MLTEDRVLGIAHPADEIIPTKEHDVAHCPYLPGYSMYCVPVKMLWPRFLTDNDSRVQIFWTNNLLSLLFK